MHKCNIDVNEEDSEVLATRSFCQKILHENTCLVLPQTKSFPSSSHRVVTSLGLFATHRPKPCRRGVFLLATPPSTRTHQNSTCSLTQVFDSFQCIFCTFSSLCSAVMTDVYSWRVTHNFIDRHNAPTKFVLSALHLCSDSSILGVSAVKLDAPLGLTSCSPVFPLFQTDIRLSQNFFLLFTCLEFYCINFIQHCLFNSCSAILRVWSNSNTAWASCRTSVLIHKAL